jgi:MFS family permease
MVIAPVAGRQADRIGGKWILVTGLSLWCVGMAVVVWLAQVDTGQWGLLPGVLIAGAGLGMTFAPLQTIAMRNVAPQMAGAASGFINTTRQLGAVIGSAAVGALLQAQLASNLNDRAVANASALPEQFRAQFIDAFGKAGGSSLHVGVGQPGANIPAGVPEQARQAITEVALRTFHEAYTSAMRATLLLPLIVLALAAVACLFIKRRKATPPTTPVPAGDAAPAGATA